MVYSGLAETEPQGRVTVESEYVAAEADSATF